MQHETLAGAARGQGRPCLSQFPFWDSGECNPEPGNVWYAVEVFYRSQFPFWDFGECNIEMGKNDLGEAGLGLSIPFLGFR